MKRIFLILMSALFFGACSTLKVTSDYDKTVDFSKYKTYSYLGWAEGSDQIMTRFDKERIEQAFAEEFAKRGMTYQESGGDVVISLFLVVDQKTGTTAYTNHYGSPAFGGYYYGYDWAWGMGYSTTTYHDYDYEVGTLVCDVFDASTKKLVWQGVGSGTVDENPNTREKNIPKKIAQLMAEYPVPVPQ